MNDRDPSLTRRGLLAGAATLAFGLRASGSMAHEPGSAAEGGESELRAQRLAWAGVRLELPSGALFVDPLVSPEVWGTALKDPLVPFENAPAARHVLVTHLHNDHFDAAAVRQILPANGNLFCHADVAAVAASRGFRVRSVETWEPVLVGDFTITAVPAVDGSGDPQVSWVVTAGGRRIFHGGDTLWHGHWWKIGRQLGPFDAAFLPINGARFRSRAPFAEVPAVMTPEQAVAAAVVLGARRLVPIHFGVVGADDYEEQPDVEASVVEWGRRRRVAVEMLRPGDWVSWSSG
jgi:L-ascorbate metabolism protein UlaG (beta-lactamase superfamily)